MDQKLDDAQALKKLRDLIEPIAVAILTTREADGTLHSRPMRTEKMEPDGTLLFFTAADSAKVEEFTRYPQVSLAYVSENQHVAIAGHARLRRDAAKMKELWKPLYRAWFPKGLEDPNLALLQVTIDRAEYWETPSSMVVRLIGGAKALATGEPAGETVGTHGRMNR